MPSQSLVRWLQGDSQARTRGSHSASTWKSTASSSRRSTGRWRDRRAIPICRCPQQPKRRASPACRKRRPGTSTTLHKILHGPRHCARRSLHDFPTWCEALREPLLSEPHCGRLAATSPQLAPPAQSYAALANAGAGSLFSAMAGMQETLARQQLAEANYRNAIVVLGYWRSGTTLLHELLCLDTRYTYPDDACLHEPSSFRSHRGFGAGRGRRQPAAADGRDGGPGRFAAGRRVRTAVTGRAFSL